jgi:VAD1 Analog of StAR-related lipid transfer domain
LWRILPKDHTDTLALVSRTFSITVGPWSKHDDHVGLGTLPAGLTSEDIVGAEKEATYLMPKSAFVKANTCYETSYIDVYNDYCFVIRKKTLTPEVPYGSTFVAWTKYVVINTGVESCKLICSVEAEFPNGPPMISRQIKNGMRAGVGELFVKIGETINKYADHYP